MPGDHRLCGVDAAPAGAEALKKLALNTTGSFSASVPACSGRDTR